MENPSGSNAKQITTQFQIFCLQSVPEAILCCFDLSLVGKLENDIYDDIFKFLSSVSKKGS